MHSEIDAKALATARRKSGAWSITTAQSKRLISAYLEASTQSTGAGVTEPESIDLHAYRVAHLPYPDAAPFDDAFLGDGESVHVTQEAAELEAIFDLEWQADAVARWREANPGNELVLPDRANMVVWLLDRLAAQEAELEAYRSAAKAAP